MCEKITISIILVIHFLYNNQREWHCIYPNCADVPLRNYSLTHLHKLALYGSTTSSAPTLPVGDTVTSVCCCWVLTTIQCKGRLSFGLQAPLCRGASVAALPFEQHVTCVKKMQSSGSFDYCAVLTAGLQTVFGILHECFFCDLILKVQALWWRHITENSEVPEALDA